VNEYFQRLALRLIAEHIAPASLTLDELEAAVA
jgi:hypothetical protein